MLYALFTYYAYCSHTINNKPTSEMLHSAKAPASNMKCTQQRKKKAKFEFEAVHWP